MEIRDRIKELRRVKASELLPNSRNWRKHPQAQADALRGLLAEIGYAGALIAREVPGGKLELIDGHLRAETTPDSMVPVLILDVDGDEANKLLASMDPLAAMAEADKDMLSALLANVETENEALQAMLDGLAKDNQVFPEPGTGGDDFDAAAAEDGPCRVKPGDLWVIGGTHRLLCGDSTKAEDVGRLMAGEKAGLCFTSPPYAQQRDYGAKITDWDGLMQGVFGNLPMTDEGQVLVNLGLVHKDGEWIPYWDEWIEWMRVQGWRRFGWYVWDQGSGLPGDWNGRFAPSHEFVWHFNKQSVKPVKTVPKSPNSGPMGSNLRSQDGKNKQPSSVCNDTNKIPDSVIRVNRNSAHGTGHPATFPISLASAIAESWPNDVYDPFLGSGTTIVAAHRLGRRCYGLEIEPRYCEVILKRCEAEGLTVELAPK